MRQATSRPAEWLNGEIDAANLNALAAGRGLPSTIFHLAGGSSVGLSIAQPFEDFSRTVASTARLLEWLRGSAPECRLIVASSAAVYGADHGGPISEDAVPAPMSPYGQHKLMMEQLCRSYAMTFGVAQHGRAIVLGLRSASCVSNCCGTSVPGLQQGERTLVLGGTGAEMRDWTDVRDVRPAVGQDRRTAAAGTVSRHQWRVGSRHERRRHRDMLVRNWGCDDRRALFRCCPGRRSLQSAGRRRRLASPAIRMADPDRPGARGLCELVQGSGPLSDRAPLRVAFTNIPRRLWAGGYNYQSNLFAALNRYCPGEISPGRVRGMDDDAAELAALAQIPGVEIVRSAVFDRRRSGLAACARARGRQAAAAEFRPNASTLCSKTPVFSAGVCRFRRSPGFRIFSIAGCRSCFRRPPDGVAILAFARRSRLAAHHAEQRKRASRLPEILSGFGERRLGGAVRDAAAPALLTANPSDVLAQYGLPPKYFYLPNQFWRHKNHQVVVDALAILKKRGPDVVVAASGSTDDPREPDYFGGLMRQVKIAVSKRIFATSE